MTARAAAGGGGGLAKTTADGLYVHQDGTGLPASVVKVSVLTPGNLGAAFSVDLASKQQEIRVSAALNVSSVVTIANPAAGARVVLLLTNSGGNSLTISDGSTSQSVLIPQGAGAFFAVQVDCPNSTDLDVTPLSLPPGVLQQSDYDTLMPWVVSVDLPALILDAAVKVGTWVPNHSTSSAQIENISNSTNAQNDAIGVDLMLSAGTWDFAMNSVKALTCAIATVTLDGVTLGTLDTFNGSTILNQPSSILGFNVATNGKHRLTLTAATRNASATGFTLQIAKLQLRRTV